MRESKSEMPPKSRIRSAGAALLLLAGVLLPVLLLAGCKKAEPAVTEVPAAATETPVAPPDQAAPDKPDPSVH